MKLTGIVNECLSETLKDYHLSSEQDVEGDVVEGSPSYEIGRASPHAQETGNYLCSIDLCMDPTASGMTPRYDGGEAILFEVPGYFFDLNAGNGIGTSDPLCHGAAAFGIPESVFHQTAQNEGD